jgi:predicted Fe-Mo cluster-binding NifX family protein
MLAGGMGRQAIGIFQEYGIQAVTGATGSVRHALEQYLVGTLQRTEPCRESIKHAHEEAINVSLLEDTHKMGARRGKSGGCKRGSKYYSDS